MEKDAGQEKQISGIMAEQTYESKITSSRSSARALYAALGDMRNIESVRHLIPEDKVSDIEADADRLRFKVDGLGQKVSVTVVDRKENDTLKYLIDAVMMKANVWIQMKEVAEGDTRLKITLRSDIPMMLRMMVEKKLKEGLDQAAEMIAAMQF